MDFAKGGANAGENAEDAALREVHEETGYRARITGRLLGVFKGDTSTTLFFLMAPVGLQERFDKETEATVWVDLDEAKAKVSLNRTAAGRARDLAVINAIAGQTDKRLPYDMGNAGDLLKHGVLAETLSHRLIFRRAQPVRFLDLFGGEPFSCGIPHEIVDRVGKLSECALQDGQPDIRAGKYYGSGMLARKLGDRLGGHVSVFASDRDEGRRERLREAGLRPLEEAFPRLGDPTNYDAYQALDVIRSETTSNDLILVDPFAKFLKPDAGGSNRAEHVLPMLSQIANCSSVLLFVLNKSPFNRVGRRFDELLQNHFSRAFMMSCPPIRPSKIKGESKYYADVVLAGPDLVGDPAAVAHLRFRLELLVQELADALGLSERGHMIMRPRTVGTRSPRSAP